MFLTEIKEVSKKSLCITVGGATPNVSCIFPFKFNGIVYNTCIWNQAHMTDHKAWCSTLVDNKGKHVGGQGKWGTCGPGCPIPPDDNNFLQVRLQGGSKPNEGFIEIKPSNDTWGGICDDFFEKPEADVICRMVGYSNGAEKAWRGKYPESVNQYMTTDKHSFGHGSGKFYLDDVNCKGNEVSILQCEHRGWGVVNGCYNGHEYGSHKHEWAAVTCLE